MCRGAGVSVPGMTIKLENAGIAVRDLDGPGCRGDARLPLAARCRHLPGRSSKLTYLRGPSDIIVMLAEALQKG